MIGDVQFRRKTVQQHGLANAVFTRNDGETGPLAQSVEQYLMLPAQLSGRNK